jgi:hypothetical protein
MSVCHRPACTRSAKYSRVRRPPGPAGLPWRQKAEGGHRGSRRLLDDLQGERLRHISADWARPRRCFYITGHPTAAVSPVGTTSPRRTTFARGSVSSPGRVARRTGFVAEPRSDRGCHHPWRLFGGARTSPPIASVDTQDGEGYSTRAHRSAKKLPRARRPTPSGWAAGARKATPVVGSRPSQSRTVNDTFRALAATAQKCANRISA